MHNPLIHLATILIGNLEGIILANTRAVKEEWGWNLRAIQIYWIIQTLEGLILDKQ